MNLMDTTNQTRIFQEELRIAGMKYPNGYFFDREPFYHGDPITGRLFARERTATAATLDRINQYEGERRP